MSWPYRFVDLTHEQRHERRVLLDRYGVYAQLSALVPIALYQLYRLTAWVYSERQKIKPGYSAVPGSPAAKKVRQSKAARIAKKWRITVWWLGGDLAPGWGLRGHWIAGLAWTTWLLFLCIHGTGDGT